MDVTDPKEVKKLKVADLKKACETYGLSSAGLKAELVTRLEEYLEQRQSGVSLVSSASSGSAPAPAPAAAAAAAPLATHSAQNNANAYNNTSQSNNNNQQTTNTSTSTSPQATSSVTGSSGASASASPSTQQPSAGKVILSKTSAGASDIEELLAKKKLRAEKFGVAVELSEAEKKRLREARFGLQNDQAQQNNKHEHQQPQAKKQKTSENPSSSVNADELERLKKRAEKFGQATSKVLIDANEEAKRAARAARFAAQ